MASVVELGSPDHTPQIRQVQVFTLVWMLIEVVVSWFSAWRARSPALVAFGGDSVIELASAVVVLWRFRSGSACETEESRAPRIAGALLFVLAARVTMAEDEGMNPTLAKALAALVPTGILLVGSTLQFSRRKGMAAVFQLAACLMVVVIAHLCEALGFDLVAAIGGLALFPIGYLFGALTREVA